MTYAKAIDFLYNDLPVYQHAGVVAYKPSLKNIIELCEALKNPQNQWKSVHIAGTNGKGSTAHMLSSVLQTAGYKVGLHTSPHLVSFTERNKINGVEMSESFVATFVKKNLSLIKNLQASFFEVVVAMGFDYFAQEKVDIAIIETGLGGRLDATNIINPEVSVITNVGLDHVNILGESLEQIAQEKAGIIKPYTPIVIGEKREQLIEIFQSIAREKKAEMHFPLDLPSKIDLDLKGIHQKENAKTVLATLEILNQKGFSTTPENISKGLENVMKNTGLQGRWQVVQKKPYMVLDTAHNADGFKQIQKQLEIFKGLKKIFVLGFVADKNVKEILTYLPQNATYFFCEPNIPRALNLMELKKIVPSGIEAYYFNNLEKAFSAAEKIANAEDFIYIGGSNFIVGEFLENYPRD